MSLQIARHHSTLVQGVSVVNKCLSAHPLKHTVKLN
jgi:hypothetical protein